VLSTFVQGIVMMAGTFIGMFILDVRLGAFCLAIFPLIILLMVVYRRYSSRIYRRARKKISELNAKLNESLQGMNIIQAMRQEKRMKTEFGQFVAPAGGLFRLLIVCDHCALFFWCDLHCGSRPNRRALCLFKLLGSLF
jgi:ABC-type multidrug transport system fused ATPase/permease subunit